MYIFQSKTILNSNIDTVFEFFCKAENLQKLTLPSLNFKILNDLPIEMKKGAFIDYQIKLYGIPVKWKTEITAWNPPFEFEDTQLKGPYKLWRHSHMFKSLGDKTEMTDIVKYNPKGWPFNSLLNKFFVRSEIEKIFNYREQKISSIFT
jgi:ligand-binding SRPBCC domain-containing protein